MPAVPRSSGPPCLEEGARLSPAANRVFLRRVMTGAAGMRHRAVATDVEVIVVLTGWESGEEALEDGAGEEIECLDEAGCLVRETEGELVTLDSAHDGWFYGGEDPDSGAVEERGHGH